MWRTGRCLVQPVMRWCTSHSVSVHETPYDIKTTSVVHYHCEGRFEAVAHSSPFVFLKRVLRQPGRVLVLGQAALWGPSYSFWIFFLRCRWNLNSKCTSTMNPPFGIHPGHSRTSTCLCWFLICACQPWSLHETNTNGCSIPRILKAIIC